MIKKLWIIGVLVSYAAMAEDDSNEVTITAHSREHLESRRGGESTIIRPSDETRFDTATQYKDDPSIRGVDRGGGFSLPLFRGQDGRFTHIFIDDMELVDPYSGFALMDDIDLRAFGEMRIHKGQSPWNIPVTQPGGVVQFLPRPVVSPSVSGGYSVGDVSGEQVWSLIQKPIEDDFDTRLYASTMMSSGHYSYYSDNGTIRNVDDDAIRRRDNNDRRGHQLFGQAHWHSDRTSLRLLGWEQGSSQGFASGRASGDGNARQKANTRVGELSLRHNATDTLYVSAGAGTVLANRAFQDPGHDISLADKRTLETKSTTESVGIGNDGTQVAWVLRQKFTDVKVRQISSVLSEDFAPKRQLSAIYGGGSIHFSEQWEMELKAEAENTNTHGGGASLFWNAGDFDVWTQVGESERAPSLLENVGNGAEIQSAADLRAENGIFGELGWRKHNAAWHDWRGEQSIAIWGQRWQERIRVLPVSSTAYRAVNTGVERFNGVDFRTAWTIGRAELEGAASMINATNEQGYVVPWVPAWQAVLEASYHFLRNIALRGTDRYQGQMYDDYENTLEIGDVWIQDATIDWNDKASHVSLGGGIYNIGNVQSVAVHDVATGQGDGRMAWQSYGREPLPGRQWIVKLALRF